MAGQPKRAKIKAELERLAAQAEVATPLEYIELRLESGDTLLDVCSQLSIAVSERCYPGAVQRLLIDEAGGMELLSQRLNAARRRGAAVMAEEAKSIADESGETPGSVAKARNQSDARFRLAQAWDRERFGTNASPALAISIGALHLEALRKVNSERLAARASIDAMLLPTTDLSDVVEIEP